MEDLERPEQAELHSLPARYGADTHADDPMASARVPQPATEGEDGMGRRASLAAIAIAAIGGLLAPAAEAGRPDRFVEPPIEAFVDASCPDAIAPEGIRWSDGGGRFAVLLFADGGELRVGRHPDRMTNVATGESVLLDLRGSIRARLAGDGVRATMRGTNGLILYPGDSGPGDTGEPRVYVFTGVVRVTFDAAFAVTELEFAGTARDVCAEL
jgi:hypothetical protein